MCLQLSFSHATITRELQVRIQTHDCFSPQLSGLAEKQHKQHLNILNFVSAQLYFNVSSNKSKHNQFRETVLGSVLHRDSD